MTEELWSKLTTYNSIHTHPWPSFDPHYLTEEMVTIVIQVNGKLRDSLQVESQKAQVQSTIEALVQKSEKVKKYLANQKIRKVIFIPGKLINFVI